jgi:hypothetical protein
MSSSCYVLPYLGCRTNNFCFFEGAPRHLGSIVNTHFEDKKVSNTISFGAQIDKLHYKNITIDCLF